jgi:CheY-like chemotaxis protein
MNGILGMTELVLDSELSFDQRESLDLVRLSAESLLSVINDILDFSKIEAGKLDFESIPFDLRENLGDTMKTLGFRAHQKGLELICDVGPEVPRAFSGDPGRLRQILVNLVGNAIKFTAQGEIEIKVGLASQSEENAALHFSVRDTGVGIPQDKLEKIFEPFSQADGSMARKFGGTGLGLSISSRLVEMMGGRIWVESDALGSTFHFTVSLALQSEQGAPLATLAPAQLEGLEVLVVDDNYTNRQVLAGLLARWKMIPTVVDGGRSALAELEIARNAGRTFSLVLLDGQMPEMDGFTLAQEIQKRPDLVGSTVMMLTSADQLGDAALCRRVGISAYLVKPVRPAELRNVISASLNLRPTETARTVKETEPPAEPRSLRVLVAEDNKVNQRLAFRLLEKRGCEVTLAEDGRAALAALEQAQFDLVLMDVQMPEMDGFEATKMIRLKELQTGKHMPILAVTAHALKGDQERCLEAGMDGYVSKPIRAEELDAAIESVVGERRGPVSEELIEQVK